jgi:hypothetical protein
VGLPMAPLLSGTSKSGSGLRSPMPEVVHPALRTKIDDNHVKDNIVAPRSLIGQHRSPNNSFLWYLLEC